MHGFGSLTPFSKPDFMVYGHGPQNMMRCCCYAMQFPAKAQIIAARTSVIVNKQVVWALSQTRAKAVLLLLCRTLDRHQVHL